MRFKMNRNLDGAVYLTRVYGPADDLTRLAVEAAPFRADPARPILSAVDSLHAIAALALTDQGAPRPRFTVYLSAPAGAYDLTAGGSDRGPIDPGKALRLTDRPRPGYIRLGTYTAPDDPYEALTAIKGVASQLARITGLPLI
jgi:hypothetical protein